MGYAAIAALLWLAQDSMLFFPQALAGPPRAPAGWTLESVEHRAADGTRLAGVLVRPPVQRPALLIHYGGNAEEVTAYAAVADESYGQRAVLLVNYRGYGASEGRPGERALVSDALEIFDRAAGRDDLDASRISLHGRSLGAAVAVQVAAARPVRCVVLTSPFTSARDIGRRLYPWLPVALLLRHPFDAAALAPRVTVPALFVFGEADTLIPPGNSRDLARAWGGPVRFAALPGRGHNDLAMDAGYHGAIRAFLDECG